MLIIKRAYVRADPEDGRRVLVDRLWPRGVSKAKIDDWRNNLAPSDELRKWFGHDLARWEEFRSRYEEELSGAEQQEDIEELADRASRSSVTLVYGARDSEHNNAKVLERLILSQMAKVHA